MITLEKWLTEFRNRFNAEELSCGVYKAIIKISMVRVDGKIECHRLDYTAKERSENEKKNINHPRI